MNTVTYESIQTQNDIEFLDSLVRSFTTIQGLIKTNNLHSGLKAFNDKYISTEYDKIDKLISERFGFKVKHVFGRQPYAVMPAKFGRPSIIDRNISRTVEELSKANAQCRGECNPDLKPEDIRTIVLKDDFHSIIKQYLRNLKDVEKSFTDGTVVIDNENAVIKGLKLTYPVYILVNPVILVRDFKLTPLECVATLLHECGHIFTHIEYSIYNIQRSVLFMENVLGYLGKGGNKVIDKEKVDHVLTMEDEELKIVNEHNKSYVSNSERLADQFSARFGLARETASAVVKIGEVSRFYASSLAMTNRITTFGIGILIYIVLGGIALDIYALYLLATTLTNYLLKVFSGSSRSKETSYDTEVERLRLLKEDLIAQIRLGGVNKRYIKDYVDQINDIELMMLDIPNESTIDRLADMLGINKKSLGVHNMAMLRGTLLNNDLYAKAIQIEKGL